MLESVSSVCTVTQGDDGTGAGGVGWSEAEAGRSLGKRCGSLRDMTTFVSANSRAAISVPRVSPWRQPEDGLEPPRSIFCAENRVLI